MNLRWKVLVLASLLELAILVAAHGSHGHAEHLDDDAAAGPVYYSNVTSSNSAHGSHSHMHAGTPKTVINEVSYRPASRCDIATTYDFLDWVFSKATAGFSQSAWPQTKPLR
jgi:hypothetical protein